MRLLNTRTGKLKDFQSEVPQYTILSHTWEIEEVTYQDLMNSNYQNKAGWSKIKMCCAVAKHDGWEWVWIDTCCIDKSSSAELSEAVNSMFRWYGDAAVCYAYLCDFPYRRTSGTFHYEHIAISQSRWFTRGWTLQELLAPKYLLFLSQEWAEIGTKSSLSREIEAGTGISEADAASFGSCSVARRLSWAAKRKTTRVEDEAYCLLGLFDINMPLLYGEGRNAFRRLQIEVINSSMDQSILAWNSFDELEKYPQSLVLAPSPQYFEDGGNIRHFQSENSHSRSPILYEMTNKGLTMDVELWTDQEPEADYTYIAQLNCKRGLDDRTVGIRLAPRGSRDKLKFTRSMLWEIEQIEENKLSQRAKRDWARITIEDDPKDRSNEGVWTFPLHKTIRVSPRCSPNIDIVAIWILEAPRERVKGKIVYSGAQAAIDHAESFSLAHFDNRDMLALVSFTAKSESPLTQLRRRDFYIASLTYLTVQARGRISLDVFRSRSVIRASSMVETFADSALELSRARDLPSAYVDMRIDELQATPRVVARIKPGVDDPSVSSKQVIMHLDVVGY